MDHPINNGPDPVCEGISTTGAARNWPLNSWWVAAHGSEVTEKPTLRWVLEMPLALYRRSNGDSMALHKRCSQSLGAPEPGEVAGDGLICLYDRLQLAPNGQWTHDFQELLDFYSLSVDGMVGMDRINFSAGRVFLTMPATIV